MPCRGAHRLRGELLPELMWVGVGGWRGGQWTDFCVAGGSGAQEPPFTEVGRAFFSGALEEPGPETASLPDCRETLVMLVHCFGSSCLAFSGGQCWRIFSSHKGHQLEAAMEGSTFWGTGAGGKRGRTLSGSFYHLAHWGQRKETWHPFLPANSDCELRQERSLSVFP